MAFLNRVKCCSSHRLCHDGSQNLLKSPAKSTFLDLHPIVAYTDPSFPRKFVAPTLPNTVGVADQVDYSGIHFKVRSILIRCQNLLREHLEVPLSLPVKTMQTLQDPKVEKSLSTRAVISHFAYLQVNI